MSLEHIVFAMAFFLQGTVGFVVGLFFAVKDHERRITEIEKKMGKE